MAAQPINYVSLESFQNVIDGSIPVGVAKNADAADKLNSNAGSTSQPVFFQNGVPEACGSSLGVNITGSAASANTANNATNDQNGANIANTYVKRAGMSTASFSVDSEGNVTLKGAAQNILGGVSIYEDSSGYLCFDTSLPSA